LLIKQKCAKYIQFVNNAVFNYEQNLVDLHVGSQSLSEFILGN